VVPFTQSLRAEVEVFPPAQDMLSDGVDVVTAVLVPVVVVVAAGEAVTGRLAAGHVAIAVDVVIQFSCLVVSLTPRLCDDALDHVLPLQLAHVVDHLAVKVRVVRSLCRCCYRSVGRIVPSVTRQGWSRHLISRGHRHGPVPEWSGGVPGEEVG